MFIAPSISIHFGLLPSYKRDVPYVEGLYEAKRGEHKGWGTNVVSSI